MCGGWTSEIFEKMDRGYVRPVLFGVRFIGFIFIEASHSVTFAVMFVRSCIVLRPPLFNNLNLVISRE
jgi:hypothetical protein